MEFVDVETAKNSTGLRGAFVGGAPSPWGEAAKGFFHIKKIPYVRTRYLPGGDNTALVEWTGVDSGPALVYENEAPRSGWAEILLLAERLAPEPRLIPEDPEQRALLFGLANELCGEMGLGWSMRLVMVDRALDPNVEFPMDAGTAQYMGSKYGYRPGIGPEVRKRTIDVLQLFSQRLKDQQAKGSKFLMGDSLTALDVYWATFAALIAPLPPDKCPMMEGLRKVFEASDPEIANVVAAVEVYNTKLQQSDLPKLLLTCTPGALITAEMVSWCQQNLKNLKVVDIGPGRHFVQEDNPHLIGKEISEWYASL